MNGAANTATQTECPTCNGLGKMACTGLGRCLGGCDCSDWPICPTCRGNGAIAATCFDCDSEIDLRPSESGRLYCGVCLAQRGAHKSCLRPGPRAEGAEMPAIAHREPTSATWRSVLATSVITVRPSRVAS